MTINGKRNTLCGKWLIRGYCELSDGHPGVCTGSADVSNDSLAPAPVTVYYLAGPMAGYVDHNHPAFNTTTAQLRKQGLKVINPAEYGNLVDGWQECMKRDIHALLWCDAIITMPQWMHSRGATLEVRIARDLEMPVHPLYDFLSKEVIINIGEMMVKLTSSQNNQ